MPELPEVEGFRVVVDRHATGRVITRARALDDWMLKEVRPRKFERRIARRVVGRVERRGKILLAFIRPDDGEADAPVLALHFGMTGRPVVDAAGSEIHRWDRLVLDLDSGESLRYRNSRRLGFIRLVGRMDVADLLWGLGPDPLEAPMGWFRDALQARRAPVKAVLLDQAFLAGVGNIYADEALLAAGIRPDRPARDLSKDEASALHRELRRILNRAVRAHRSGRDAHFPLLDLRRTASANLARTGVPGVPCPKCGRPLHSAKAGGRTSFYCQRCQR